MARNINYRSVPSYHRLEQRLWQDSFAACRSSEMSIMSIDRYFGPREGGELQVHDYWEMGCIVRGAIQFIGTDTVDLKAGTVFIIPPKTPHAEQSLSPADIIWISLSGTRLDKKKATKMTAVKNHEITRMIENLWIFTEIEEQGIGPELDAKTAEIVAKFFRIQDQANLSETSDIVERGIAFMNSHLSKPISIPDIVTHLGCCQTYFRRLFKTRTNRTPVEYLQELRMRYAASLLEHTSMSIDEIAHIVGYADPFYFSRIFSKTYKLSPSKFRKSLCSN